MEKLDQLRFFLGGLGIKLPGSKQTQPGDYAKLLTMLAGRPDEHMLNMIILRSLQQAIYTPDNAGHFGLAYKEYTHFTSPIRRYPDLLNHRAIKYVLSKQKSNQYPYDHAAINNSGEHCSMTERRADDATRDAIGWLKCEYMLDKVGKTYDGVISGVMNFGVFVELKEVYVEGLIHITSLQNDYYRFDPVRHCLEGKRTRKCYRIGDQVRIVVARVDLDSRQIDFALA
jgi:ribonuclease R